MGAAPQGGTSAQLGGESCGCLASVANGLQHKQKLKQDDGGALRLVVASAHPPSLQLTCLAGTPSRAHAQGVGCPHLISIWGLPEGAVGIHGISQDPHKGADTRELLTGPVQRHTQVVHQS